MQNPVSTIATTSSPARAKFADYVQLAKPRLSFSVVFSAGAGYLLAASTFNLAVFLALIVGGFFVVGASNAYNQMIERHRDALMDRTKNRPLAAGRMTLAEAAVAATLFALLGLAMLFAINPMSASFGALSIFIYVLIYTPLKAKTPFAVFVGAIPGAIPFMLGWVAATNDFDIEPGTLFAIQFLWQFPHFWAIAWLLYDDYAKAGYYLLPNRKRDKSAAVQVLSYTLYLVFASIIPVFGFTGTLTLSLWAALLIVLLGAYLFFKAVRLFKNMDAKAAKGLMFASILYLPLVQIIYVVDKWL